MATRWLPRHKGGSEQQQQDSVSRQLSQISFGADRPHGVAAPAISSDSVLKFGELARVDPRGGTVALQLPKVTAADVGKIVSVVNITDSTNTVNIKAAPGQTLNGSANRTYTTANFTALLFCASPTTWVAQLERTNQADTPVPELAWASVSTVTLGVPEYLAVVDRSVALTLQDGITYTMGADLTLGWSDIDTGAEASSTWYHVYAVPDTGTVLKGVISTSDPATGPTGYTEFAPCGCFYNDSGSDIVPFYYDGPWYHYESQDDLPVPYSASGQAPAAGISSWTTTGLSTFIPTASVDFIAPVGFMDAEAGATNFFLTGSTTHATVGNLSGHVFGAVQGDTRSACQSRPVPIPNGNIYTAFFGAGVPARSGVDITVSISGFRYKYLGGKA